MTAHPRMCFGGQVEALSWCKTASLLARSFAECRTSVEYESGPWKQSSLCARISTEPNMLGSEPFGTKSASRAASQIMGLLPGWLDLVGNLLVLSSDFLKALWSSPRNPSFLIKPRKIFY